MINGASNHMGEWISQPFYYGFVDLSILTISYKAHILSNCG